jgi:hypothetical protein
MLMVGLGLAAVDRGWFRGESNWFCFWFWMWIWGCIIISWQWTIWDRLHRFRAAASIFHGIVTNRLPIGRVAAGLHGGQLPRGAIARGG